MSNKLLVSLLATFAFMNFANADHHEGAAGENMEKKPFSIYGDFAGSYTMQGNEYSNNTGGTAAAAGGTNQASPAQHNNFSVDNAFVNVEKNWSKSKFHILVGYGAAGSRYIPNANQVINLFNAYYQMNSSYGLSFMFGRYDSPMGYESYTIMNNRQFTRSWGFTQHNYVQTGLGVNYDVNGMANVGFHVANDGVQNANDNNANKNQTMTLDVSITAVENLAVDLKYQTGVQGAVGGSNTVNTMEITVAYMVNEMFDFAIDYLNRSEDAAAGTDPSSTSTAVYLNGNFGYLGASLRYEMFNYEGTFANAAGTIALPNAVGNDNDIQSITASVHYDIDQNARTILEYRTDSSDDQAGWVDKDGTATDSANTITLGLMYRF